ncbi:hypothetical protein NHJ13051_006288 [Beauveria bassiana]
MASEAADRTIDELLERYLGLLDQHATLRASLAAAQQDTLHSLARANFSAPRGARYGPDQYDARMQASRRVVIVVEDKSAPPTFTVTEDDAVVGSTREGGGGGGGGGEEGAGKDAAAARDDPIRWFGVLVPQALRDAQSHARRAVQDVIPRLASVQVEMAHVEIEVRRARKRRAKASGGGGQKQDVVGSTAQTVSASS